MAFKIGDWVQITNTPDVFWSRWYNNMDIYNKFAGRVGQIVDIGEDDERQGQYLYSILVNFPKGLKDLPAGKYEEFFKDNHIIHSSPANAYTQESMIKAAEDLQKWEKFKRESTDRMLRHIFGPEEKDDEEVTEKIRKYNPDDEYIDYQYIYDTDV